MKEGYIMKPKVTSETLNKKQEAIRDIFKNKGFNKIPRYNVFAVLPEFYPVGTSSWILSNFSEEDLNTYKYELNKQKTRLVASEYSWVADPFRPVAWNYTGKIRLKQKQEGEAKEEALALDKEYRAIKPSITQFKSDILDVFSSVLSKEEVGSWACIKLAPHNYLTIKEYLNRATTHSSLAKDVPALNLKFLLKGLRKAVCQHNKLINTQKYLDKHNILCLEIEISNPESSWVETRNSIADLSLTFELDDILEHYIYVKMARENYSKLLNIKGLKIMEKGTAYQMFEENCKIEKVIRT